jgi:hypothetical protein
VNYELYDLVWSEPVSQRVRHENGPGKTGRMWLKTRITESSEDWRDVASQVTGFLLTVPMLVE